MNTQSRKANTIFSKFSHIDLRDRHGKLKLLEILKSPFFYAGIALKFFFILSFSSNYFTELFLPASQYVFNEDFFKFYSHFSKVNPDTFPYPPLMLYIFSIPLILANFFGLSFSATLSSVLIKLVILFFDTLGLIVLYRWAKEKTTKVLLLIWLSPILLFVNFGFTQLDIIPTSISIVALYYLFKRKYIISFLFLALALSTKTHLLILLPLFYLFSYRNRAEKREIFYSTLILILTLFVIFLPFWNNEFINMVFNNTAQQKALSLKITFGENTSLYIAPLVIFILGIYTLLLKRLNKDTVLMLIGFVFGCILLFSTPSAGWYSWIIPFLGYFFIKRNDNSWLLFLAFQLLALIHSLLSGGINSYENLLFLGSNLDVSSNTMFQDMSFTFSKALLVMSCAWVYLKGISQFSNMLLYSKPFLVGIAGDSGVGKSTLSDSIKSVFSKFNTTVLHGDDMHRWQRGDANWSQFTHLNPKANELYTEFYFLRALKKGVPTSRRHYDHNTGEFLEPTPVESKPLVIFEGLHTFFLKHVRELFDLKIYIEPEENLRRKWKIDRDVHSRGKDIKQAIHQIESRLSDGKSFISPQREHADLIIQVQPSNRDERLFHRFIISNTFDIIPLIENLESLESNDFMCKHWYESDQQIVECSGKLSYPELEVLRDKFLQELEDFGIDDINWETDIKNIPQFFVSYLILHKVRSSNESID